MPKHLQRIEKASCLSRWSSSSKWFVFEFYEGYFPKKDQPSFLKICIPSTENTRTVALAESVKSRIKHAGFEIGHYTVTYCPSLD